ncbi:MAG: 8-oxo-dGTP pyrophosphatase MutT (NUDIX family) [Candidatus Azotimanducaceae bacterium]
MGSKTLNLGALDLGILDLTTMDLKRRNRVFTYITHQDQLLVFDHVGFPNAGTQVPGGTIEKNENPRDASRREAKEETGIASFTDNYLIANERIDMRPYGKLEELGAWFFHLKTNERVGDKWQRAETSPSNGGIDPIWFSLYWVNIVVKLSLVAEDGRHLEAVRERCLLGS